MKKILFLISFIVALNTYSAFVSAHDDDYYDYDYDDGYRYSQPRCDYNQQNRIYYPQPPVQYYYPQPQANYYNGQPQPYYYPPTMDYWVVFSGAF